MKDKRGLYYYPSVQNKKIRMYVRENDGHIQFRLWNQDYPVIWKKHHWTDWEAILKASEMYKKEQEGKDPLVLYDIDIAKKLLEEEG